VSRDASLDSCFCFCRVRPCRLAINGSIVALTLAALAAAIAGMWVGQALRARLHPATFRRWFFAGLLLLGLYLVAGVVR
jgi:uncharacterized membrane protein YfcA